MPRGTMKVPACAAGLCPVALLKFLARPAPARVVAADLLDRGDAPLLDDRRRLLVLGVLTGLAGGRLGERARAAVDAARVGHAARARLRPARRVLLLGRGAVVALDLDLDVEDHPREV